VCLGVDDFARKALGKIQRVELPTKGARLKRGDVLCVVRRGDELVRVRTPLSGEVTQVNSDLQSEPALLSQSPYDRGWVCVVRPSDLATELRALRIGDPVVSWYQDEVTRLRRETAESKDGEMRWAELDKKFFDPALASPEPETASVG
jgi:glycine cleavage system H lipoate-binding protein